MEEHYEPNAEGECHMCYLDDRIADRREQAEPDENESARYPPRSALHEKCPL
jgi:hypothetical protein